jgi:hypothetical protein
MSDGKEAWILDRPRQKLKQHDVAVRPTAKTVSRSAKRRLNKAAFSYLYHS